MKKNEVTKKDNSKVMEEMPIVDKIWYLGLICFSSLVTILFFILTFISEGLFGDWPNIVGIIIFLFQISILLVTIFLIKKMKRIIPLKRDVSAMVIRTCIGCVIIFTYVSISFLLREIIISVM